MRRQLINSNGILRHRVFVMPRVVVKWAINRYIRPATVVELTTLFKHHAQRRGEAVL
jgi:hypothetical protein